MAKFLDKMKNVMFGKIDDGYDEYDNYDEYDDGYDGYDEYSDGYGSDQIAYGSGSSYYDNSYDSGYGSYEDEVDYGSSRKSKTSTKSKFKSYTGGKSKSKSASKTTYNDYAEPEKDWHMIIQSPTSFDDSSRISNYVKEGKAVVVNFEKVSIREAQRIMDFLSGTCCSLNGDIAKVGANIFVISPSTVGVRSDMEENTRRHSSYDNMQKVSYGGR